MRKISEIDVKGTSVRVMRVEDEDYICLTDMLKAKDGDFFVIDWLRNRNTLEYLGIWEKVYNPNFNYGEFAIIRGNHVPATVTRAQMKVLANGMDSRRLLK